MPEPHVCDRFGVTTGVEALYVKEKQNVLVDVEGDVAYVVAITLYTYALRAVPILYSVTPVGLDVFPYRLHW